MKTPPYNTGKVSIGLAYLSQQKQRYSPTSFENSLQSALLNKTPKTNRIDAVCYAVASVALLGLLLFV